jgi:hypothetical protein
MPITTTPERIASIADGMTYAVGTVTYTVKAFDPPLAKAPDTAQLPALYIYTRRGVYDWDYYGDNFGREVREYSIRLAVLPAAEATPELIEIRCRPALVAVRDRYASRPSLGNLAGVQSALITSDSGPIVLPEYGGVNIGIEFVMSVEEQFDRTFSDNE